MDLTEIIIGKKKKSFEDIKLLNFRKFDMILQLQS